MSLTDLALFDRTEQGEQLVQLHLLYIEVMQDMAREGFEVIGGLHQPAQYRGGIGLKHPGHGAAPEALGQSRNGPHELVRLHLLAVQWRAMGLQEMPLATETHQLAPASAARMAIGADIPPAHPAMVRTGGMGAEVARGVDVPAAASGERH